MDAEFGADGGDRCHQTGDGFFLEEFVAAGSDSFLAHFEGNVNLHRTVQRIKALGKRAGLVINPATPASVLEEILQDLDQVLVMTVDPRIWASAFPSYCCQKSSWSAK